MSRRAGGRRFAERIIALEAQGTQASESNVPAVLLVCDKLRPYLAAVIGSTGFHALLSRAIALAKAESLWLRGLQVKGDGSLGELEECGVPVEPEEVTEGSVLLVAELFGLLATFIGENLTLRMVREVWPKLSPGDLVFSKED